MMLGNVQLERMHCFSVAILKRLAAIVCIAYVLTDVKLQQITFHAQLLMAYCALDLS